MDNLVLIRVAAALDSGFRGAVLTDAVQDSRHRFRLGFETTAGPRSVVVSIKPELPWIGRPVGPWEARRVRSTALGNQLAKSLRGRVVERIDKPSPDRAVWIRFSGGTAVVCELATHGANLVLLDADGKLVGAARRPRSAKRRLTPGERYRPPELPAKLFVPFGREAGEIDAVLGELATAEPDPFEALRRRMFGVGSEGAALVVAEARRSGRSPGQVLAARLAELERGGLDPVILGVDPGADPLRAAIRGTLDLDRLRLLPWPVADQRDVLRRSDAAATAGLFHESVERMARLGERIGGLRTILEREIRRTDTALREVERDRDRFGDPETHRVWGEAILAGLDGARRVGEAILVRDPYGAGDTQIAVPADPALSPTEVAETHFGRSRRARRGIERAESRLGALRGRRGRLETLLAGIGDLAGETGVAELERRMLAERIPVGLEPDRRGRASARLSRPRIEGVRVYAASDGSTILAGKGGRDNHRLTFKLSSPTDFWFHAEDAPGAHVILRNEERIAQPSERALAEAAGVAAWYSDLRGEEWVTVRWTQRKNVRKPRSATPGTVVIKRFRTVRVRPALPGGSGKPTR